MNDSGAIVFPGRHHAILQRSADAGFAMNCDALTANLLRALVASKPGGRFQAPYGPF